MPQHRQTVICLKSSNIKCSDPLFQTCLLPLYIPFNKLACLQHIKETNSLSTHVLQKNISETATWLVARNISSVHKLNIPGRKVLILKTGANVGPRTKAYWGRIPLRGGTSNRRRKIGLILFEHLIWKIGGNSRPWLIRWILLRVSSYELLKSLLSFAKFYTCIKFLSKVHWSFN